jgi:chemotaxis protein MotB
MIEESKQGLNIELMDQNGSSMFPESSKEPYERTRRLVQRLSASLKTLPYRLSISGHTAASKQPGKPGYGPWELSADRANSIRKILEEEGVPAASFFMVAGRADTQPLFPDDPFVAANRRVTITLMQEAPPLPANLRP